MHGQNEARYTSEEDKDHCTVPDCIYFMKRARTSIFATEGEGSISCQDNFINVMLAVRLWLRKINRTELFWTSSRAQVNISVLGLQIDAAYSSLLRTIVLYGMSFDKTVKRSYDGGVPLGTFSFANYFADVQTPAKRGSYRNTELGV